MFSVYFDSSNIAQVYFLNISDSKSLNSSAVAGLAVCKSRSIVAGSKCFEFLCKPFLDVIALQQASSRSCDGLVQPRERNWALDTLEHPA